MSNPTTGLIDNYGIRWNWGTETLEMNTGDETWIAVPGVGETITASEIDSESATDGYVLTADGAGGAAWEVATGGIDQLTGDVTAGPGSGSQATTLATVNSNVGSFTNASITVNGKGLITAASNGATIVDGEVPSGAINSSNVTYTLANTPSPATSLHLYKNGIRLKLTDDYTLSTATITMVSAPATSSTLLADYRY